jgi:hypothetical protein
MKLFIIFCLLPIFIVCSATPATLDNNLVQPATNNFEDSFMKKLTTKCSDNDNGSCLMVKFIAYMNKLLKKSKIALSDSVELTQTREVEVKEDEDESKFLARSSATDEEKARNLIAEKIYRFFNSRTLRWNIFDEADVVMSNENGRLNLGLSVDTHKAFESRRNKIKTVAPAIIAAVAAKIGLIAALAFKGVAMLVGNAFVLSKVAFIVAVVIAIKKLFIKKAVTYDILAHPIASHEHHHHVDALGLTGPSAVGGQGWGRAFDGFFDTFAESTSDYFDKHNVVYNSQKP